MMLTILLESTMDATTAKSLTDGNAMSINIIRVNAPKSVETEEITAHLSATTTMLHKTLMATLMVATTDNTNSVSHAGEVATITAEMSATKSAVMATISTLLNAKTETSPTEMGKFCCLFL